MYFTIVETYAEYQKRIREWERQYHYERSIVCSVPEKNISVSVVELVTNRQEEPG